MTDTGITRRHAFQYVGIIMMAAASGCNRSPQLGSAPAVHGYGPDPDLHKRVVTWPLDLGSAQVVSLTMLTNIILPQEPPHPSAGEIGVQNFINEWVSAPYPQMQEDRKVILAGLATLNMNARKKIGKDFQLLSEAQATALFDRVCSDSSTVDFARRLIRLTCDGYYSTEKGHAAIGYIGNVASATFAPVSPEARKHLEAALRSMT